LAVTRARTAHVTAEFARHRSAVARHTDAAAPEDENPPVGPLRTVARPVDPAASEVDALRRRRRADSI